MDEGDWLGLVVFVLYSALGWLVSQVQKGLGSNCSHNAVGLLSLANCSHLSCLCSTSSEMVAALLTVVRVTAGLVESNGSLPPGLCLASPAG